MAGEIYIADKETLDLVKSDTAFIKGQFPVSGGFDWRNYSALSKEYRHSSSGNENITLLDISGAGFITDISVESGYLSSAVEIILDGVTIFHTDTQLASGICQQSSILSNSAGHARIPFFSEGTDYSLQIASRFVNLPYVNSGVASAITVLTIPIQFNSSLKVILHNTSGSPRVFRCIVRGGLLNA